MNIMVEKVEEESAVDDDEDSKNNIALGVA